MCGLCGFTGQVIDRENVIKNMTDIITHRGPDSAGFFSDENIVMGFRRLSIIDLDNGTQPIYNEDENLVLNFNGEIYNHKELRKELINLGHEFYTETDSEVLIHGFEEWGVNLLNKLRGMFGFAIWNREDQSLFIARDFFGIKPMHYTQFGDTFIYASEIKSILKHPMFEKKFNYNALDKYLSFQYSVPPETFFEGVYCLLPGHYLFYKDGKIDIQKYFEPRFHVDESIDLDKAIDMIEEVFEDSVDAHKISDVEVGCFLSSGVDSSYVSTYFKNQKSFTVGFDFGEKYNEISFAKDLSDNIKVKHYSKIISPEEFWGSIEKVQYYMDQPLADPSCIALYFVSQIASEHVKVVLSGEGADELFGGYPIYNEPGAFKIYNKVLPKYIRQSLAKFVSRFKPFKGQSYIIRGSMDVEEKFIGNAFMYTEEEKRRILKNSSVSTPPQTFCKRFYDRVKGFDPATKMQYIDINLWMVGDILLKADRMSMANSLELRVPFLDKKVFEVASKLPAKLRANRLNTKYALRMAAMRHLPEDVAQREKLGFPVPTRVWLRDEKYYNVVKKALESKTANEFFNTEHLLTMLDDHYNNEKVDHSRKIWTIYTFLVWYKLYFENDTLNIPKGYDNNSVKSKSKSKKYKNLKKEDALNLN